MSTYGLFYPGTVPANVAADPSSVSLGTAFRLSVTGWVTGIRFWKSPNDAGPWDVYLYDQGSGDVLAYKNVTSAVDGWNTALFDTAYPTVVSSIPYVAVFHTDTGNYGYTPHVFDSGVTVGPITGAASGTGDNVFNGVFGYGSGGPSAPVPSGHFNNAWYGVEPVFTDTDPGLTSINASLTVTEGSDTVSGATVSPIAAVLAVTEAGDVLASGVGNLTTASMSITEQGDSLVASAVALIAAVLSVAEGNDVLASGVGNLTTAALMVTELADTVSAAATVALFDVIHAGLSVTDGDDAVHAAARVVARNPFPTLSEIIPAILNSLVDGRVWQMATPDNLPRGSNGSILPFVLWHRVGGMDQEFIDQTMPTHRHARIQVQSCAPGAIAADTLHEDVCQALLASVYTVGVLGSPVGTYDADRKLHAPWQQFSIWFQPQPVGE